MRSILDKTDSVLLRNRAERIHIRTGSGEMNRNDQFGAWRNMSFDLVRIHHQRIPVDIDKDRGRPRKNGQVDHGNPRHGGRNDLVSGTDSKRMQKHFHHPRLGSHGNRVRRTEILFEIGFQLRHFRTGGNPAGTENIGNGLNIGFLQIRFGKRQKCVSHNFGLPLNIPDWFPD